MTQYDYEDDEFDGAEETAVEAKLPNPARKHLRDLEKRAQQLETELKTRDEQLTKFLLRDRLAERGITDERASRWLQRDVENLNDQAAVDAWMEENGSLFGGNPAATSSTSDEARQAYERMATSEARGLPVPDGEEETLAAIKNQKTPEELKAYLKAKGF